MDLNNLCNNEICRNLAQENVRLKEQNATLLEEIQTLMRKMQHSEAGTPNAKSFVIYRLGLPAELLNEMFVAMPLKDAYGLLAGMPNCLLARNVRKMLKQMKMSLRNNKWNIAECGSNISISEDGLELTPTWQHHFFRANLPIPNFTLLNKKPYIASYFEVHILKQFPWLVSIKIGYSDQFQIKFGIITKQIVHINEEEVVVKLNENAPVEDRFNDGDVVGFGLLRSPAKSSLKCFASCNGELLGTIILPEKFAAIQLFPAILLGWGGDLIRANFGKEKWLFNPSQLADDKFI